MLVLCCALELSEGAEARLRQELADVDLDLLVDLALWHCVAPLAAKALGELLAPEHPALQQLQENYAECVWRYRLQVANARETTELLTAAGLRPVAFKGLALAEPVYGDPGLRPMGDIDLWLPDDEALEADRVLRAAGWYSQDRQQQQRRARRSHYHLPRLTSPDGFASLELHRLLHQLDRPGNGAGYLERAEMLTLAAPDAVGRETSFEIRGLGPEDRLIALAVHFALDRTVYYQSYAALRQLTDIHLAASEPSLDWSGLLELARAEQLVPWVWLGLESACRVLESPIPENVRRQLRDGVPRAHQIERFIDCKVLEGSPWVLHQLVQPEERSTWSLSKALLRRVFWDPRYLREKFGDDAPGAYLRHTSEMIGSLARAPHTLDQLRVDGWIAELHQRTAGAN